MKIQETKPGNILDYMRWRGDLSFKAAPLNEIDNLILSQLAYVELDGIVTGDCAENGITVKDAADAYFARIDIEEHMKRVSAIKHIIFVFQEMAETERFKNAMLFSYVNEISEKEQSQFCALAIALDDGTVYVSYSGTDDTIVGWREDFNMSFLEHVPGSIKAVEYLNRLKINNETKLYIGGHSKGGNFAIQAGIYCRDDIRDRILAIYNNDGPGFSQAVVESEQYQRCLPLIRTFMPEASIVGMMFEHADDYTFISSSNKGLMQHDALSWNVLGASFERVDGISKRARMLDKAVKQWTEELSSDQLKRFVDVLFGLLDEAEIKTVNDLVPEKENHIFKLLKAHQELADDDKKLMEKLMGKFIRSAIEQFGKNDEP